MQKSVFSVYRFCLMGVSVIGAAALVHHNPIQHSVHPTIGGATPPVAVRPLGAIADRFTVEAANHPTGSMVVLAKYTTLTPVQEAEITRLGGAIRRRLPLISRVAIRIPRQNLSQLANLPFVSHLSADTTVHKTDEFTVKASRADVAYQNYGLTGTGIGVAVVDSGIDARPDLKYGIGPTRVIATKDLVDPTNTSPKDECGHGTHIAGIIAGNGSRSSGFNNTHTFFGIARNANLVNVRVLDAHGDGSVSDVIDGLSWIVQNRGRYNIRVVNLALGHPVGESYTTDPLCEAIEQLWKAGIVVVTSAGNYGRQSNTVDNRFGNEGHGTNYGSIQSPGNSPFAITVGATKAFSSVDASYDSTQRNGDKIATYSSRGPSVGDLVLKPDIVAPGNRIISVRPKDGYLPTVYPDNEVYKSWYIANGDPTVRSKDYYVLSGTSMAAPVVAGAVALLLEKNPRLTPDTVKARLMLSTDKWGNPDGTTDPFTFGTGYLNIASALRSNVKAQGYALSPTVTVQSNGTLTLAAGTAFTRGSLWGTGVTDMRAVWGNAFQTATIIADNGYLWTTANQLQGDIILWGEGGKPLATTTTNGAIILWGEGGMPYSIPTANGTIILWGEGGKPVTGATEIGPSIILWGEGGKPNYTEPVTPAIILWGEGGKPLNIGVDNSIILWGEGGKP